MFTNIKKDALWKPLLRQFRRFIKQLSNNNIQSKSETEIVPNFLSGGDVQEKNELKTSQF